MKKVLVIGCPGAGKSTFARKLSAKTGLPLYYLDMIWHKADRTTVSTEEFDTALSEIMNHDRWILDGNYLRTLPMRLEKADTVFFFDLPLDVCLSGAIERLGKERVDMPWKDDVLDEEFRQWITDFPETQLPIINLLLESYGSNVVRFTSRQEADEYIERL
jgi:adenylate kinase family enzyme